MNWDLVVIFGFIFGIVAVNTTLRHRERMAMIDKKINPFVQGPPAIKTGKTVLFLGLVSVAVGLALFVSSLFVHKQFDREMMTGALFCLFGGGALLVYWFITASDREHIKRVQDAHIRHYTDSQDLGTSHQSFREPEGEPSEAQDETSGE